MKPIVRALFLPLVMLAAVLAFGQSIALADDGTAASSPLSMVWPLLALACGSLGALIRNKTPSTGFFHTVPGHIALMLLSALLASLGPMFQGGIVTKATLIAALIGAGSGFFAALKTSSSDAGTGKLTMIVPLAFLLLAVPSCQTPGGQALKTCEMNALPQVEQTVLAEVGTVLMNPAAVVADLVALAAQLGPAQVNCAVQAWETYLASKQKSGATLVAGVAASQAQRALSLAQSYLAQHPSTSCSAKRIAFDVRALEDPPACYAPTVIEKVAGIVEDWL